MGRKGKPGLVCCGLLVDMATVDGEKVNFCHLLYRQDRTPALYAAGGLNFGVAKKALLEGGSAGFRVARGVFFNARVGYVCVLWNSQKEKKYKVYNPKEFPEALLPRMVNSKAMFPYAVYQPDCEESNFLASLTQSDSTDGQVAVTDLIIAGLERASEVKRQDITTTTSP